MAKFEYTAVTPQGMLSKGSREADTVDRLRDLLARDSMELVSYKQRNKRAERRNASYKMKNSELANMIFQIGIQLRSGVPILDALQTHDGEDSKSRSAPVRQRLAEIVEQGTPVSQGMAEFPRVFPTYVRNIVQVAERSGSLSENLIQLREYLEWMDKNWKSFKQALLYPMCVVLALVAFIFIALRFVFPTITKMLYELEIPLPWITQVMIQASEFVQHQWWSILAVGFVLPTALRLLFSFSKRAALLRDHAIIKLPFLGDIVLNLAVNRFLRSLILMQQAGIVITEALASSRDVVDNKVLESSLQRVENAVANGWTLSKAMTREKVFPPLVLTMVGVGERSGSLDDSLQSVVEYYDDLVPRKIKAFFAILEPGLILITICMAGMVAAAVFLPLIKMLSPGSY